MSSVVVVLRALIMLACLLAVPVLAMTQGEAVWRAKQAVQRFVHRVTAERTADAEAVGNSVAGPGLGSPRQIRPSTPHGEEPGASPEPAAFPSYIPVQYFPEPIDDAVAELAAQDQSSGQTISRSPEIEPPAGRPSGSPLPAEPLHARSWQEKALALQDLGAVEYVLEKWGSSGELYRFRCLVAVAPAAAYCKHFEAVDSDGGLAVERVVEQVRSWRASAE